MALVHWNYRPTQLQLHPEEEAPVQASRWRSIERLALSGLAISAAAIVLLLTSNNNPLLPFGTSSSGSSTGREHSAVPATLGLSEYVPAYDLANSCPYGTVALSETECRHLPDKLSAALHDPFIITSPDDPQGCFVFRDWVYYNLHPVGLGREKRNVYCRRASAPSRFQKISKGLCTDYGFLPIEQPALCEHAAREMRLTDVYVHFTRETSRPQGCYYFANLTDSTGTLWINQESKSKGNGAQASPGRKTWTRQPLCVAQTTPEPLPLSSALTTTNRDLASSYVAGQPGVNGCQPGTVPLAEVECQKMPLYFEGHLHEPFVIHSVSEPRGCVFRLGKFAYNIHTDGAPNRTSRVYCRVSQTEAALRGRGALNSRCGNACHLAVSMGNVTKS